MQRVSELLAQANAHFDKVESVRKEEDDARKGLQEAIAQQIQHDITYFEGLLKVLEKEQLFYLRATQEC